MTYEEEQKENREIIKLVTKTALLGIIVLEKGTKNIYVTYGFKM